ncbi:MAG: TolC family protein [Tannerella sp.]|jgi:outer membrane protein TolC|nr:TolC family protein [Tannerella sp.]
MKRIILPTVLIFVSVQFLFSQENTALSLSLSQSVQMAVKENINMKTVRMDAEKSQLKKAEAISSLIPKINVGANFQDNLKLPTTMLPGELAGIPGTTIPVQMGSTFNTSAAISLNWAFYNQTAISAVQLAQKVIELNVLSIEKASEELAAEVAKLYFLTVTTSQQKELIEENITRVKRLQDITKLLVDNGMGKQVDYDRVSINIENLNTQLSNVKAGMEQQHNMIKYMLKIPLENALILTDSPTMDLLQNLPETAINFYEHIDMRLLESQNEINRTNQKMITVGYLPTLSFSGQYSVQGMRKEFNNYFNNSPENKWFGSSYIGIGLSIPIFDGFEKRSKSRQVKLEIQKTEALLVDKNEKFTADYISSINNYYNNKSNVDSQLKNIELAEKVYNETDLKYREGLATMSNLLQDEMSLNTAQANYLTALYNYKEAELKIMSLNGQILSIMN